MDIIEGRISLQKNLVEKVCPREIMVGLELYIEPIYNSCIYSMYVCMYVQSQGWILDLVKEVHNYRHTCALSFNHAYNC